MEVLHKSPRKEKIYHKSSNLTKNDLDSTALSTDNLHRKNKKKRKREKDSLDVEIVTIKKKKNCDTSDEFSNNSGLKIKKEKSDAKDTQDNENTKKKRKQSKINEVSSSFHDESDCNDVFDSEIKIKKKIKTEPETRDNFKLDSEFNSEISDDQLKKKKKKKHKEHDTSNSSVNTSYYSDVNNIDDKKKKLKVEHASVIKQKKKDDADSLEIDVLYDRNIKKKKKKKEKKDGIEDVDQSSITSYEEITKKVKNEPKDSRVEVPLLENNVQLVNVDESVDDDSSNRKKKKKKKHKHIDTEAISSDVSLHLKSEDKIVSKVKNEVLEISSHKENVDIKHKPSDWLSTKSHSKKARVKIEYENSESDADYYSRDTKVESDKRKKKGSEIDKVSFDDTEVSKKSKTKKHKSIENNILEKSVQELEEENRTKNYTEEKNEEEFVSEGKSKKKKHKKNDKESIQLDDTQKIDTEYTELAEHQPKKKKKKKHSEELSEENLDESVHLDLDFVSNYDNQKNEDISNSCKKKKRNKHKHREDSIEVKNETVCDSSNEKSTKKKKSRKSVKIIEDKFSDDSDCEVSSSKNVKAIEDKSSDNSDNKKSKLKKAKKIKDRTSEDESSSKKSSSESTKIVEGKSVNESSDLESEEGDYSESEITPRIHKLESIYAKYPKVARMMKESDDDDDDDLPHLQHRKLTLSEAVKLSKIKIEVRHEVPPQHQVEKYCGTRPLNAEEKVEFEKYMKIKKGRFNSEEDRRIVHNWKKFCKRHNWNRSIMFPFLHQKKRGFFFATSVEERKKFVQILAKGLPNRSLYSVYYRFRNLYSTHKRNRYSKAEDETILCELKDLQGRNRFSVLARKLNRTRASIWRRYKLITKKKKGSDSEDETSV